MIIEDPCLLRALVGFCDHDEPWGFEFLLPCNFFHFNSVIMVSECYFTVTILFVSFKELFHASRIQHTVNPNFNDGETTLVNLHIGATKTEKILIPSWNERASSPKCTFAYVVDCAASFLIRSSSMPSTKLVKIVLVQLND